MGCEGRKGEVGGLRTGNLHRIDSNRGTRKGGGREENRVGGHEGRKKRPCQCQNRAGPGGLRLDDQEMVGLVSRALPGKGGEMDFSNFKVGRYL